MLGKKQTKIAAGRLVGNHGNKGRPFRLALPLADYCDNSAERKLLTPVKTAEGPNSMFVFVARHFKLLLKDSIFGYHTDQNFCM